MKCLFVRRVSRRVACCRGRSWVIFRSLMCSYGVFVASSRRSCISRCLGASFIGGSSRLSTFVGSGLC